MTSLAAALSNCWQRTLNAESMVAYHRAHKIRFQKSLQILAPYLKPNAHVLDVGGHGTFVAEMLSWLGRNVTVENFQGADIRKPWVTRRRTYDLILSWEVLEHLKDPESSKRDVFGYVGLMHFFIEARNRLASHGTMMVSTPNTGTYKSMLRLLQQRSLFMYNLHPRELSVHELRELHDASGLVVRELRTEWCFGSESKWHKGNAVAIKMMEAMKKGGYDQLRGDDLFVVSRVGRPPPLTVTFHKKMQKPMAIGCKNGARRSTVRDCDREWRLIESST